MMDWIICSRCGMWSEKTEPVIVDGHEIGRACPDCMNIIFSGIKLEEKNIVDRT